MKRSRLGGLFMAALLLSATMAGTVVGLAQSPAAASVTTVKGSACGYTATVGLFGGAQGTLGCDPESAGGGTFPSAGTHSPSVTLAPNGSNSPQSASDSD